MDKNDDTIKVRIHIIMNDRKKFLETLIKPPKKIYEKCIVERDPSQRQISISEKQLSKPNKNNNTNNTYERFPDRCPKGEKCDDKSCQRRHPAIPCSHRRKCNRKDCFFTHATGREIDEQNDDASSQKSSNSDDGSNSTKSNRGRRCPKNLGCRNPKCTFVHPNRDCRDNTNCNQVCHARHPNGRVFDGTAKEDDDDWNLT